MYTITREKFFEMKAMQKYIMAERRSRTDETGYEVLRAQWWAEAPKEVPSLSAMLCNLGCTHHIPNPKYQQYLAAKDKWEHTRPKRTPLCEKAHNDSYVRSFNIAYSLVRGRTYEQIEVKTRLGNKPNWDEVKRILREYDAVEVQ